VIAISSKGNAIGGRKSGACYWTGVKRMKERFERLRKMV
jgi:hypothetical protein